MARTSTCSMLRVAMVAMLGLLSPATTHAQDIGQVDSLNRQVSDLIDQDRYAEAATIAEHTLALAENSLGREHRVTLASVTGLAEVFYGQGRYGDAEALFKRALEARERVLGREHPETLRNLVNLAIVYHARGRFSDAESFYTRALEAYERILGKDHPSVLNCVLSLSSLYRMQGDSKRAAAFLKRGTIGLVERSLREVQQSAKTPAGALEGVPTIAFRNVVKVVNRLVASGRELPAVATQEQFQTAQWALGSEAAQSLAQMAIRGAGGNPQLAPLVREHEDLVAEWQKREIHWSAGLGQQATDRSAAAEAENTERMVAIDKRIAEIDKKLETEFPDYTALASPRPLSVDAVMKLIGADEALVLFLDTRDAEGMPEETFIWVVTKARARWVRSDLGTAALTREVQALRCGLDEEEWRRPTSVRRCMGLLGLTEQPASTLPLRFDLGRAHKLYKSLFGQVEDLIKGKQLLIVPSGPLTQLPFHALVTASPTGGDYRSAAWLARGHALSVLPAVPSLKALRSTGRPSAATKPLIGFGNPLLNGPDDRYARLAKLAGEKLTCPKRPWQRVKALFGLRNGATPIEMRGGLANVSRLRELIPVPETADELCSVASDIGADASEIHLGARATEHEVKAMSERGELAKYRVLHFGTHCEMAGGLSEGFEPGLILTPPVTAGADDDGYLSGSEIASLKLDADWVILSPCNSAAGDAASAEALSSLARAFIYAQARALLVSHWAVDSDATVKLITSAIHEVAREKTVGRAEALRQAMLALIDKGEPHEAHPAYWAPFIILGEGAR